MLMQFQADVLGVPVERPDLVETTALGAAGLAGLATGIWKGGADFAGRRAFARFDPCTDREGAYEGWRRAVDTVLYWARYGRS
jgi:glycerol kinase